MKEQKQNGGKNMEMNNEIESVEIDDQCNNFLTTELNFLNHRTLDKIILQKKIYNFASLIITN